MKRYKLKKDSLCAKAGTVFEERVDEFDGKILINEEFKYKIIADRVDDFDDWLEEIPEPSIRSRVAYGCIYYYVNNYGIVSCSYDYRNEDDNYLYGIGNYFKTEEEAKVYRRYLLARQILIDDADGGEYSYGEENWCTYYSKYTQEWTGFDNDIYHPGMIYFRTGEALKKSLKEHKEQWRIVCKYEMGEV